MLDSLTSKGPRPIGVDVGRSTVRMAQLSAKAPGGVVMSHATVRGTEPCDSEAYLDAAIGAVRRSIGRGTFAGRDVRIALPTELIRFKSVRLPDMPDEEIAEAIKWETDKLPGLEPQDIISQHIPLGRVRQGEETLREVLVMCAPLKWIESFTEAMDRLKLEVRSLEVAPTAAAEAFFRQTEPRLVVDFGGGSTRAMIVERGEVHFFKVLGPGQLEMDQRVAERLRLSIADAAETRLAMATEGAADRRVQEAVRETVAEIGRELSLCIRYYTASFRGERPETGLAIGGGAALQSLLDDVGEAAGITLTPFNPFQALGVEHKEDDCPWRSTVALALASDPKPIKPAEASKPTAPSEQAPRKEAA
ncbi:MAG: pilus assembly protein PilM [Planctomycetota bacterium]